MNATSNSSPGETGGSNADLAAMNRAMAKGAGWMVAMRFAIRSIGLVSTVILARLLVPGDFGLVALATMIYGGIEIMGSLGFDVVLIQNQKAGRDYYDSAWTLSIIRGLAVGAILVSIAGPAAAFFGDGRLTDIIYLLSAVAVVAGLENIGTVDFRKDMTFGKDFQFLVSNKLIAFVVTVALAVLLRTYWALVCGIVAGGVAKTVLSYVLHPYRPRLSLSRWREIMGVSKWLLLTNILHFFNQRADSFIVGKIAGATGLGLYSVAYEIATLATSELVMPIRRALFPGYAKLAHDMATLRRSFLDGLAMILMLGAPAAVGVGLIADPLVRLFLGEKWLDAIPLLQVLAIFGVFQISRANGESVFLAMGHPRLVMVVNAVSLLTGIPLYIWATLTWGLIGTVWALAATSLVTVIVLFYLLATKLELGIIQLVATIWRTFAAILVMIAAFTLKDAFMIQSANIAFSMMNFVVLVVFGAVTYVAAHLLLWIMCGRCEGPESQVLRVAVGRAPRLKRLFGDVRP